MGDIDVDGLRKFLEYTNLFFRKDLNYLMTYELTLAIKNKIASIRLNDDLIGS